MSTGMRPTDMPELPEVETVRRELTKRIVNKTFDKPVVFFKGMIKTPLNEYVQGLENKTILEIRRRGKFLIFLLNDDHQVLFHLRMEGKLFVVDKESHPSSHLSLFIPFRNDEEGLAFYDVRKFGVSYYLKKDEEGPLEELGREPFEINDPQYLFDIYKTKKKPIKELLLDQSIMSGLGNIYADEVCFASSISPFMPGNKVTLKNCEDILSNSIRILTQSIENHGSTVRSYKATEDVEGSFQNFLKVYSRDGKECTRCKTFKTEKRKLEGRGTSYCPKCQHTGVSLAITGKIGSGKSLALSYFRELGYKTMSCDEEVGKLYKDKAFLTELKKKFPDVFNPEVDKVLVSEKLVSDKAFKRNYQNFIFSIIRRRVNEFIIDNDDVNKAIEVPLLFDAKMDKGFTYLIGCETTRQEEHLKERGDKDIEDRLKFNNLNSYDKNHHKLDFILKTDGTKEHLKEQVENIDRKIKEKLTSSL